MNERNAQHHTYITKVQPRLQAIISDTGTSLDTKMHLLQAQIPALDNETTVGMAIKLLDQVFLDGALAAHVKVDGRSLVDCYGCCSINKDSVRGYVLLIELDFTKMPSEWLFRSILVHEMLHAYVKLHTCRCSQQCMANQLVLDRNGPRGHGWYWQLLAEAAGALGRALWGAPYDVSRINGTLQDLEDVEDIIANRFIRKCFSDQDVADGLRSIRDGFRQGNGA